MALTKISIDRQMKANWAIRTLEYTHESKKKKKRERRRKNAMGSSMDGPRKYLTK